MKNHETTSKTHGNQPKTAKKNMKPPWNQLNPWKPIKSDMEPWKTNLEPSKLTWSCTGWLWGVQVVTGDSQEEVIIFRDKQTHMHHNIYIIIIIVTREVISKLVRYRPPAKKIPSRPSTEMFSSKFRVTIEWSEISETKEYLYSWDETSKDVLKSIYRTEISWSKSRVTVWIFRFLLA